MPRHFLSVWAFVIVSLCACRQDVSDPQTQPNSFFHDRKILMPTAEDDAKIVITANTVMLTKAHLSDVRTELYQPSFRLEGIIAPAISSTVHLPDDGSLYSLSVRLGDKVIQNTPIARMSQIVPAPAVNTPDDTDDTDKASIDPSNEIQLPDPSDTEHANDSPADSDERNLDSHHDDADDDFAINTPSTKIIAINAPISGNVQEIFIHDTKKVYPKHTALMVIGNDTHLKFVSLLPKKYKEHLGVGKAVNFSTKIGQSFVGQIAKITPHQNNLDMLEVHVHINADEAKKVNLKTGDQVSGHIDYGQMSVGALVPAFAIFDDKMRIMDLSALNAPPHKPAMPIHANVWLVGQDGIIRLTATEVIEYRPNSNQYLVAGIAPENLICLSGLPKQVSGKQVRLDWSF